MNEYEKALQSMLEYVQSGKAVLTAGQIHPDIPTIHDLARGEYHESVRHLGFGLFQGRAPAGEFYFEGGGAMQTAYDPEGKCLFSWTPLRATPAVLVELGYDLSRVELALQGLCG